MMNVLVVDDSLSVRKVVERTLGSHGLRVLSVGSGTEAKAAIERDQPDLVICDVILPDVDGFEICGFVKTHARLAKTPVLLMSGIVNAKVADQAARVHANDLMCKPFAADELLRKTAALLASKANSLSRASGATPRIPPPEAAASRPPEAAPAHRPEPTRADTRPRVAGLDGRLNIFLEQLAALPGVKQVVLVDREGFVIASANATEAARETAGALVSCLKGPFEGMGEDLGHGALQGIIVEYERGIALLQNIGAAAVLTAVLSDPTALGKVRYFVKRSLPALLPGG
jgi:CheY-like chemotaxis protein/predicted regulator of Ras-like GTPase activity (Roadblock/LC7/MglB family)